MERAKDMLETIIKKIVSNPDDVRVEDKVDDRGILLTLFIHPSDMGIVIGKKGETARALRGIIRVAGYLGNVKVSMRINDPKSVLPSQNKDMFAKQ